MRGDQRHLEEGIAQVREEVMPAVQELDGCIGLSMLLDRDRGTAILTSAWASEDAMRDSARRVEPLRRRGAELLAARPEVREWEIAVLHREHATPDGACASVTWTRGDPRDTERNLQAFRDHVMPRLQELDGFSSVSLFIDQGAGAAVTAVVFDDRAALDHANPAIQQIREEALDSLSLELLDVAEFDVAYAHLRVPETV